MKHIKLTLNVDGEELSREYHMDENDLESFDWAKYAVSSMFDTLTKSEDKRF